MRLSPAHIPVHHCSNLLVCLPVQTVPENDHNEALFRQGYCETAAEVGIDDEWDTCMARPGSTSAAGTQYTSWLRASLRSVQQKEPSIELQARFRSSPPEAVYRMSLSLPTCSMQ